MAYRKILCVFFCFLSLSSQAISCLTDAERLSDLFDTVFEEMQQGAPEFATFVGMKKDYNALWTDHSEEGYASRSAAIKETDARLSAIDRNNLSETDQLNYDLLAAEIEDFFEKESLHVHYMPLNQMSGVHSEVEQILMMMPKENVSDYENILARLVGIPCLFDQTIALLNHGLEEGLTPPKVVLHSIPATIANLTASEVCQSPFFQPFVNFPPSIDEEMKASLTAQASSIIYDKVYPAYKKLGHYLETIYIPQCRSTIGLSELPNGAAYYQNCIKKHTTTTLSALEIHEIGLNEVNRIRKEMQNVLDAIQFSGTIEDYFTFLETSPEFYYSDAESLLNGYKDLTSYIESQLPLLFGRFPQLPFEVVPIPAFAQEGQIGAFYMPGSKDTGRPGRFYANTHDLSARPKWQMETLSLHEAVPGHHFQISLAQEIEGLPEYRKYSMYTAYIEGWGLYSESLGKELGLDLTPENQFGRLINEIWRAVRLVVDTGMHAFEWSREDAILYMREKTGIKSKEIETEIDRYIVMPGQALAYKIGELSIKRWRLEATEALGDAFDIREFHDMLLEQGALPLDVCERYVYAWIAEKKAATSLQRAS